MQDRLIMSNPILMDPKARCILESRPLHNMGYEVGSQGTIGIYSATTNIQELGIAADRKGDQVVWVGESRWFSFENRQF